MFKKSILLSGSILLASFGCDGCSEKKPEEIIKVEEKVEVKKVEVVEDPLKAAKENADALSTLRGVAVSDFAQSVAADIEAAQKRPVKKITKTTKKVEKDTGSLAANQINKVFRLHNGAMRKCYERQLKANPSLAGKVRLLVRIGSSGSVSSANASGLSGQVHKCMVTQAKTMKFPKPDGGSVSVSKPYRFSPKI